ncbi:MAG: class I SAM-dependent methyltransferase [Acidimicrobiales bacterium]
MSASQGESRDAFGVAVWDWARGGTVPEMIERDDGYMEAGAGPDVYLSGPSGWPSAERQALRHARGRVLDLGCGAGRVALYLQARGVDVVGIDSSRLAARAARHRGVDTVWCTSLERLGPRVGGFDTIVMFGNNFGLFETPERAHDRLREWAHLSKPGARIFMESTSAYGGGAPGFDRTYYRRNRQNDRPPGELRARYRYGDAIGAWFTWLFVGRAEMAEILRGTGWHQSRVFGTKIGEPYVAVLAKD